MDCGCGVRRADREHRALCRPLAELAGGVDLSTMGSAALAGLIYVVARRLIK